MDDTINIFVKSAKQQKFKSDIFPQIKHFWDEFHLKSKKDQVSKLKTEMKIK